MESLARRGFLRALPAVALIACARRRDASHLRVSGSDTMVLLTQRWAEGFMRAHAGSSIEVKGGGTGAGIAALVSGTTDLCAASRQIQASERDRVRNARGVEVLEQVVAMDALSVYVHESNTTPSLDIAQLAAVFRGKVRRWSEVGGPDVRVTCYGRESDSGSYEFFRERVMLGADYAPEVQSLVGTAAVVSAVRNDPGGIGYGGIAYAKGVRALPLRIDANLPPVAPAASRDSRYPFARPLYVYTAGPPSGLAAAFLAYALSSDGQRVVTDVGYFPVVHTS